MNTFDLIIFAPIAFGLVFGFFKGFVHEVVSFLAIFVALLSAELFTPIVMPILIHMFSLSEKSGKTLAYILVFVAIIALMFLASKFIEKILSKIHLGWLNSLAGGVLGALKFALIISVLMNVFDAVDSRFHLANQQKKESSIGYYPILKLAPTLWQESKKIYEQQKLREKFQPENDGNESKK